MSVQFVFQPIKEFLMGKYVILCMEIVDSEKYLNFVHF